MAVTVTTPHGYSTRDAENAPVTSNQYLGYSFAHAGTASAPGQGPKGSESPWGVYAWSPQLRTAWETA